MFFASICCGAKGRKRKDVGGGVVKMNYFEIENQELRIAVNGKL